MLTVADQSGMHTQCYTLAAVVERCRSRGLRTAVGGPIASSVAALDLKAEHVVIGEAESLIADLARDLEQGTHMQCTKPTRDRKWKQPATRSKLNQNESLFHHGRTVLAWLSFNCEFCGIIEIYGRRPRTKAVAQILAELVRLRAAGWRESVFIVDDKFIGNKARAKELCVALTDWRRQFKTNFDFRTEASLNLADDPELLLLMKEAGLK